ncbi:hypothetical protein [Rhodothermus profundi]|uniref:Uncharacterized protein n=1 Tax=Rhodothermus profundi TaxID=633813 RepID=A0A1M6SZD3_9BACT|nr:hypothetical protein [Rhodothermus profundi]SHK49928.1 hypothetical protein SAMN04488087_1287 [Rhodothermus profundi]
MSKVVRLLSTLLSLALINVAQSQSLEGGARAIALSGATTALAADVWAHANPAAWAGFRQAALSLMASQAYGLEALRLGAATYVQPIARLTLALGARTFGFEAYRATHFWLGIAHIVYPATRRPLQLGLSVRYQRIAIERYGAAGTLGLWAGLRAGVFPWLSVGMAATNLNAPRLAGRERLPRTLRLGLAYHPPAPFQLLLDVSKDARYAPDLRVGLEVQALPFLTLRAGTGTLPGRFTAGFGLSAGLLQTDVAVEYHTILGWSPALSITLIP